MFSLVTFIPRAIVQSVPLLLGCVGETLNEKSGSLNLGIPGVMYVGAISGVVGAFFYENSGATFNPVIGLLIPILCCMLGSLLMGLLFCFLTVTLRANQNVTGLAMTTFGVGLGNFFGGSILKLEKLGTGTESATDLIQGQFLLDAKMLQHVSEGKTFPVLQVIGAVGHFGGVFQFTVNGIRRTG